MKEQRAFANNTTQKVYGQADKKKLNRKAFAEAIKYSYLAGACASLFKLVDEVSGNTEIDRDVLVGEIQKLYLEYGNALIKQNFPKMHELSLEELMEHMGY